MGLIETASRNSLWRGVDYYQEKKVISWEASGEYTYDGVVSGSEKKKYNVHIDKAHPRKSTCNCAFAEGRRVVCKHMIALYFTADPVAYPNFLELVKRWEEEDLEMERQHVADLEKYVKSLSKAELQSQLLDALLELEERRRYW